MSSQGAQNELRLDDADKAWDELATRLESFVEAWDAGSGPPPLMDFVPEGPQALRRLALVELIKVDLEYRWLHAGPHREIESYVDAFPELDRDGVPCDLLYEEYHVRKQSGEKVEPNDYYERFPQQAGELARLLGLENPEASTSLFRGEKPVAVDAGEQFDDFDILTLLGKGAFASVYLARQRSMQRLVALKVSSDHGLEPQTLAQLDHNHIVRVFDQRVLSEKGVRLLYMQYVPGGTLQGVIEHVRNVPVSERSGRTLLEAVDRALELRGEVVPEESSLRAKLAKLSWPETVCWMGARLARALDYADRRGVLHRDVKPANVLVTAEGSPKLVDFNVSCSSKLEGASPAAFFGGSLAYMSPEQLDACNPGHSRDPESLDGRSDLYGLGILLWEMLTGSRPFRDERLEGDWSGMLAKMAERRRAGVDQVSLEQLPEECPDAVRDVLLTALTADLRERFASAGELARELELCLRPRTQELLRPPGQVWQKVVLRFSLVALLVASFVPNALAGLFNFYYNFSEIISLLEDKEEGSVDVFWKVQTAINATAFPLGHLLAAGLFWPVARGLRRGRTLRENEQQPVLPLRRRCLLIGHYVATISISLWAVAGLAYPLSMRIAGVPIEWSENLHFLVSLVLCGLIAASFPFFVITFASTRLWYPALLRSGAIVPGDLAAVERLDRIMWRYLLTAASVPMLSVTALVLIRSQNRLVMGILAAGGLVGFSIAFWLYRTIQRNLAALVPALSLTEESAGLNPELEGSVLVR